MSALFSSPWWLLALAAIGVFAISVIILNLFFSIGDRPERLRATSCPGVNTPEFMDAVSGTANAPVQQGGHATLLNNGVEIWPAIIDALSEARHTINLMTYVWEPGELSDQILAVLEERLRAGVEVRLLLDWFGALYARDEQFRTLESLGAKVCWFRGLEFGKLTRIHKRNHRRAIVIDGRVGFTGGASVADKWLGNAESAERWRDIMVRVEGCLASNLQSAFSQLWVSGYGELLVGREFYSSDGTNGDGEYISKHVCVISSPSSEANPLRPFFWLSFAAAKEKLYITNSYFAPDALMGSILAERARAGVDVRVLVPNEHTDVKPILYAGRHRYEALLKAGVRVFEYQPTMIHAKAVVVDGSWSVIGSANMDIRSKELNQEDVLGILDWGFGSQVERTFLADLERAREIRLEEWRKRGLWERFLERFFVLFEEQI